MRLAGQAKLGFYPANPAAITQLLKHLYCRTPNPEKPFDTIQICDPCCGKGEAIKQIADGLGIEYTHVYGVELDRQRGKDALEIMPGLNILEPASFLGVQITGFSFGLAYVNPPFDAELGGGRREEQTFCDRATRLLVPGGIMVLVCPLKAFVGNSGFVDFFDSHYEDVAIYKFPDGEDDKGQTIRPYNEIVVIGKKRKQAIPVDTHPRPDTTLRRMDARWGGYLDMHNLPPLGEVQPQTWNNGRPSYDRKEHLDTWEIPLGWKPNTFKKTIFTDEELVDVVKSSPLNRHLREVVIPPPAEPPLPLDRGHLGLVLASGMLDGVVEGPHGTHVVRGSSHKVEYHNKAASESTVNPDTGAVTTKDVFSEKPITVIRCVGEDGVIYTHSNDEKKPADVEAEENFDG